MAELEIHGESLEVDTVSFSSPSYYVEICFKTNDTDEGMLKSYTSMMTDVSSRRECTFDKVQQELNDISEKLKERGIEITELSSIKVREEENIKTGWSND